MKTAQDYLKKLGKESGLDPKRFRRAKNRVFFKSRIAIAKEEKHYNRWYLIATIPEDLLQIPGIEVAIARAFVNKGHRPITDDEMRTEALNYAVAG